MEHKEQVQYDFCGVPIDFSQLKQLVSTKCLIEHPTSRWIREYERVPSMEEQESVRYKGYQEIYAKEMDIFSKLEQLVESILCLIPLPQFTEGEIKALLCRFPCISYYLEGHIGVCPSVSIYLNAIMSYIPEKNYYELDYVVRSAQNGLETQIPFNEQFKASRYVPYEMEVPPYPEGFISLDSRTLINKCSVEVPDLVVDTISAQSEVNLENPVAIVFEVVDDDPQLDRPRKVRVRWDERGTTFVDQPLGLYSGGERVKFDNSVGVRDKTDYIMLKNGVMRYATEKCYVTVICDGEKIKTRDQYMMGETTVVGIWRYEMIEKRLVCRTGGQPDFYEEVRVKLVSVMRYLAEKDKLKSYPLLVNRITWVIAIQGSLLYLGRSVKRNKILNKLKQEGIVMIEDYFIMFARAFPKCVYYGDRRLLIGEHGIRKRNYETEFKRLPYHLGQLKLLET